MIVVSLAASVFWLLGDLKPSYAYNGNILFARFRTLSFLKEVFENFSDYLWPLNINKGKGDLHLRYDPLNVSKTYKESLLAG